MAWLRDVGAGAACSRAERAVERPLQRGPEADPAREDLQDLVREHVQVTGEHPQIHLVDAQVGEYGQVPGREHLVEVVVIVGDDFFVALRVIGSQVSVFLSDLTASVDWPLARQVLDYLAIPIPDDDDDLDQVLPAGDLSIFADLGIDEMDLGMLSGDLDMFPYEVLEIIARRIGFGSALERALDGALGP